MTEFVRRPRGRPSSEQGETREALLQAAQLLFAERSFMQVGIRDIAEVAGVALGSINYHFGSKEGLLEALCDRITPALLEERIARLRCVLLEDDGSRETRIRAVLRALIEPVLRWSQRPETQLFFTPFMSRVRLDGPQRIRDMMRMEVASLRPFQEALGELMPELSEAEIGWRLHFGLAIEHAMTADMERLHTLTQGASDGESLERMIERVIDFLMEGGFGSPVSLAPTSRLA